jgi:chromate transporter
MLARLWELAVLFFRLGATSFGGPVVYIALMEQETVQRRQWLSREQFLDMLAVTNLLPGPNAVEMANHIGYARAGLAGCVLAGVAFTFPGALISGALAWAYLRYGQTPQVEPFLAGLKPVVVGVVAVALWRLGRTALDRWQTALIAAAVAAVSLAGGDEVLTLLGAAVLGAVLLRLAGGGRNGKRPLPADGQQDADRCTFGQLAPAGVFGYSGIPLAVGGASGAMAAGSVSVWKLALFFLKVGAVLYGSGYVLVAYIRGGLVEQYGWLTETQLLDAVAVGQITPGPLISTVTFVGYLVAATPGAIVATVAIILPTFFFVGIVRPWIARLRSRPWTSLFLDAVTAASLGLMAAVTIQLGAASLGSLVAWLLAIAAVVLTVRWEIAAAWLLLGGAVVGALLGA